MTPPRIIIDWLQFTLLIDTGLDKVLGLLKQKKEDFKELEKGGLGYKKQIINNNIRIYYDGNKGMGVCASITGKACRYLESQGQNLWQLLQTLAHTANINITRLDIALDYYDSIMHKIVKNIRQGKYIAKVRSINFISKIGADKKEHIETIYLGSRSSDIMIRIYDKATEQQLKDGTIWERFEIVLKKDRIYKVIPMLADNINQTFYNILYTYFRPIKKIEKNISRSEIEPYYKKFLGEVEKVSLYEKKEKKTIADKYMWLEKQVAPTMAMLAKALDNTDFFGFLAEKNEYRLTEKDYELIREFKGE